MSHTDSSEQHYQETARLNELINSGKLEEMKVKDDVYFRIMQEGFGNKVNLTDTVTVYYKGYLLKDESVFDQTRPGFPATFPLNVLIRGWQLAVPECKVGGKIKIIIPSGLAYSIRTRSPKIPPNSILVFDIEILDAKPVK